MSDLISRADAISVLDNFTQTDTLGHTPRQIVEALPSAQPEIVRCKDCKHFAGEGMYCACDIIVHYDHFYCYHAERRTDE